MSRRLAWALLAALVLAARLTHAGLLWIEEAYPAAAAIQTLHGKVLYRDFFFDKPPLTPLLYLLWGAADGWPLRLAGALFVLFCAWVMSRFARQMWGEREALWAAALAAFFLTFGVPSAVMALSPDLVMLAPHAAAVWLAWRGRTFLSGLLAGAAFLIHPKGLLVLVVCLLWRHRGAHRLLAGFLAPNLLALGWLGFMGAFAPYWAQVWRWGSAYTGDTFVAHPLAEGLRRTANWMGFHAALVIGAACFWRRRAPDRWRFAGWLVLSLASAAAGLRFFPRYYFQLLPVMTLAGARGLAVAGRLPFLLALAALAVPAARFGPRYGMLALESFSGRRFEWRDTAMNRDGRLVSEQLLRHARPGDTLLIWGYRPDVWVYTRMPAGAPFLDSQPLTGVLADRHLFDSRPTMPDLARYNRALLARTQPDFIVDGLGPYNPSLAIGAFPDLAMWLRNYHEVFRSPGSVLYRRRNAGSGPAD